MPRILFIVWHLPLVLVLLFGIGSPVTLYGQGPAAADLDPVSTGLSRVEGIVLSDADDFTFAVFGDNRGSTTVFETILANISDDPDILFAVSTGDIVGTGTSDRFALFFSQVDRYLTKPLLFVAGNHELMGRGEELYASVVGPRDYSFVFGDVAFIMIDDTNRERMDAAFEEWLETELDAADRRTATLVFMHVPLYDPKGTNIRHSLHPSAAGPLMRIFRDHRITYVFCSHIHGYYYGDWQGIPYVISGGAGAPLVGTDPAHYFYHYLKVRVTDGAVTFEPVRISPGDK